MNLNSEMTIVLEGHTNGVFPSTEVDEVLSESRAKVIKSYLTENGIDPNRIQIKGWGCNKQIYPTPFDETEEGFNRRVEINIVKF